MSAINAGLEGQSEERQRHMRIVIVGRSVISAAADSDIIRWSNAKNVPTRHAGIAVQVLAAKLVGRDMKIGELRAREVGAHANLFQGFSRSLLGFGLVDLRSRESIFIKEENRPGEAAVGYILSRTESR